MSSLISQGVDWLAGQLQEAAGEAIVYTRGEANLQLTAVLGRTPFRFIDDEGYSTLERRRDFLVPAADLVVGGQRFEPAAADLITRTVDGVARKYRPNAPNGEPCWRPADPAGRLVRIHTIEVAQ